MATIQELATNMYRALERKTRDDGSDFYSFRDGSPEWMSDVAHAAHDDMFPDDWRYEIIREMCGIIADADDLDDARDDIEADYMNAELIRWLGSHGARPSYCDDAMDEYGCDFSGIMQVIALGQLTEKQEVYDGLITALTELEEDDEEEVDEA